MQALAATVLLAFVPALVKGHGIVQTIQVQGGKTFKSPTIGGSGSTGPFYLVADSNPVTDPSSKDLICGNVATKASSTPEIKAGSTLAYKWTPGYDNELSAGWPHEEGPMFWYMAKCDGDCTKAAASSSTKFFKVQQDGFVNGGKWKQADVHAGKTVSFKVPSDLQEGNYLIRHEIINLANTAEMFPSCAQFKITGGGNKVLSGDSASFPGAYSLKDKGLAVAGAAVYAITNNKGYVFPGPKVMTGLATGGDSAGSDSSNDDTSSSSAKSAAPTSGGANNGNAAQGGSDEASSPSSSAADAQPTESSSSTEDAPSSSSVPSSPSSGSVATGSISECQQAWTTCNTSYKPGNDSRSYTCQQDYTSCMANATKHVKRMHRLRRGFAPSSH